MWQMGFAIAMWQMGIWDLGVGVDLSRGVAVAGGS
jgi:hypothetical protein